MSDKSQAWWCKPVVPATGKNEAERLQVQGQPSLVRSYHKIQILNAGGCNSVLKCSGFNLQNGKKREREREIGPTKYSN